ncbi:MAG: vWA domain-containing protein, partial [Prochlorotrichaceae cyanobacterium]
MPIGLPEFANNREKRCPVILLVDTSGSMSGEPIDELNRGLSSFREDVLRDAQASLSIEVAIVTFGGEVTTVQDFVGIQDFQPPILTTSGNTPMGEALEVAMDRVEERKQNYKESEIRYFRPWIFLITDGAPTDSW